MPLFLFEKYHHCSSVQCILEYIHFLYYQCYLIEPKVNKSIKIKFNIWSVLFNYKRSQCWFSTKKLIIWGSNCIWSNIPPWITCFRRCGNCFSTTIHQRYRWIPNIVIKIKIGWICSNTTSVHINRCVTISKVYATIACSSWNSEIALSKSSRNLLLIEVFV